MNHKTCIKAGEKVKDFRLYDQDNNEFILSKYKGKRVLLSFHPLAWTKVCADQMKSLEKHWKTFEELNTVAVGLSIDSVPSKKAWAKNLDVNHIKFLSDFWPHGGIAQQFGLFRNEGYSERANVIIDENGLVEYVQVYEISTLPDIDEIVTILKTEVD